MQNRKIIILIALLVCFGLVVAAELPELMNFESSAQFLKDHPRRVQMWAACYDYIKQHPWMGGGLGNFKAQFQYIVKDREAKYTYYDQAHNEYIQTWFEMGIVGFLLIMGFICGLVRSFVRHKKSQTACLRGHDGISDKQSLQLPVSCGYDCVCSRDMDWNTGI